MFVTLSLSLNTSSPPPPPPPYRKNDDTHPADSKSDAKGDVAAHGEKLGGPTVDAMLTDHTHFKNKDSKPEASEVEARAQDKTDFGGGVSDKITGDDMHKSGDIPSDDKIAYVSVGVGFDERAVKKNDEKNDKEVDEKNIGKGDEKALGNGIECSDTDSTTAQRYLY